jgi:hypothetical protein
MASFYCTVDGINSLWWKIFKFNEATQKEMVEPKLRVFLKKKKPGLPMTIVYQTNENNPRHC